MGGLAGSTYVNADASSTFLQLAVDWDPVEAGAQEWLVTMRAALGAFGDAHGIEISMSGHPADGLDTFEAVYDRFPTIVICTGVVVLLFIGIAFKVRGGRAAEDVYAIRSFVCW